MKEKELKDRVLNENESLALITRMIRNTQDKLERDAAFPMLVWGYATVFATLVVWLMLSQTGNYKWNYFWLVIPAIGVPSTLFRKRKASGVSTYIDVTVKYIWIVFGAVGLILSAMSFFSFMRPFPILFIAVLMMSMGTVLTGLVIKFAPFVVGGIVAMLLGFALYLSKSHEMVLFALAFIAMYIIPGHMLNHKAKEECLKN